MKERAYAKINLALNVKGRREDGYHELEMIMVPIDFYDEIEMIPSDHMNYHCNRPYIVFNEKNTIVKTVKYFRENYGIRQNYRITLKKHIPTRAGMAGGSADAAALIRLYDRAHHLHLSDEEKKKVALTIGADVLFCVYQRPALVGGIGEELRFFKPSVPFRILLVKPRKGVSTAESFRSLNLEACDHPDVYALQEALEAGDYERSISLMGNSLEEPSLRLLPVIGEIKRDCLSLGADYALMSGSGSTVFVLSQNGKTLEKIERKMKERGFFVRKTRILDV